MTLLDVINWTGEVMEVNAAIFLNHFKSAKISVSSLLL